MEAQPRTELFSFLLSFFIFVRIFLFFAAMRIHGRTHAKSDKKFIILNIFTKRSV